MAAVGKKQWPAVGNLLSCRVKLGHRCVLAAGIGATGDGPPGVAIGPRAPDENHTFCIPGPTHHALTHIANWFSWTSCERRLLQLSLGKKADKLVVGRPERKAPTLGPRELVRGERIEWPHPQIRATVIVKGGENQLTAIRPEGEALPALPPDRLPLSRNPCKPTRPVAAP